MGQYGVLPNLLSAGDRADLAAYFETIIPSAPAAITTVDVPYHGSTSAIPLKLTVERFTSISYSSANVASSTGIGGTSVSGTPYTERTAIYTHTANNCSATSFTYSGTGAGTTSSTRQVNITVTPPAAPSATSSSPVAAAFNSATNIPISLGGGPAASIDIVTPPGNGSLVANGTSSFTYTSSSSSYTANTSFTYRVIGPCGAASSNVVVNINVAPPATPNLTTSVNYNPGGASATPIPLAATFGSIPISGIAIVGGTGPALGSALVSGTTVNYTPTAGNLNQDTFQYTAAWGGTTLSGQGTVTINITPPGAPTFTPMSGSVPYNAGGATATEIDLSGFFTSAVDSIAIEGVPVGGTASVVAGTRRINFTAAAFRAPGDPASVQIRAFAPGGASSLATVTITILAPGAPTIQNKAISTPFNTQIVFSLLPITGPYNNISLSATSQGGTVSLAGTDVTYTPANAFAGGTETFTYTVTAPGGANSTATVTATVIALPTVAALNLPALQFNAPATFNLPASGFTQVNVVSPPSHGSVSAPVPGSASVTYVPTAGYTGPDSFTYNATGPGGTSAAAVVTLNISTQAPTASAAHMSVQLNTAGTLDLSPFISGSSITGVTIASQPGHGTVTTNGTKVTYTPVNNYFGTDTFTYRAFGNDPSGASSPGVVSVTITGRPDPAKDATVTAILSSQVDTARRFSQAQVSNFQARMESLHRSRGSGSASDTRGVNSAPEATFSKRTSAGNRNAFGPTAANGGAPPNQAGLNASGAAYKPAASLTSDRSGNSSRAGQPIAQNNMVTTLVSALSAASQSANLTENEILAGKALNFAAGAIQNQSLNLNASTGGAESASTLPGGIDLWMGGGVRFGTRNKNSSDPLKFSTDGVSVGIDRRFSNDLALGIGLGYARDQTDIGTQGSVSHSRGTTIAAYGSYQPTENVFLDGMLGYGDLSYETKRFVAPANAFATSKRSGDYVFGSLTAGYEYRANGLMLSPYGRLDLAQHRLDAVTETGAGQFALHYARQTVPGVSFSAGLRAESVHETQFGWAMPRMRIELQHDFKGQQEAAISYADQIGGAVYLLAPAETKRNSIVMGVGSDFIFQQGLTVSVDYQMQRTPGQDNIQAVNLKLVKNLDGRNSAPGLFASVVPKKPLGIQADASFLYDDNVSRASTDPEKRQDASYALNLSKNFSKPLNENTRLGVSVSLGGEKFRENSGLDRVFGGIHGELQYRSSGDYDSPTFGLFGSATLDEYESALRDGHRITYGISMRQPVTDRLSLTGALARNIRDGRSAVFDTKEYSAKLNVDYELLAGGTVYLSGEFRKGDIISSGQHTLDNIDIAKVFSQDDVYTRPQLYNYRFDGRTAIVTLGYSLPFGPKDSLDFSWRRVVSTPSLKPSFVTKSSQYVTNQFSIAYLLSF